MAGSAPAGKGQRLAVKLTENGGLGGKVVGEEGEEDFGCLFVCSFVCLRLVVGSVTDQIWRRYYRGKFEILNEVGLGLGFWLVGALEAQLLHSRTKAQIYL